MEKNAENLARETLVSFGLKIEKIDETSTKTADFFGTANKEKYLIEVKTKDDNNPLYNNLKENGSVIQSKSLKTRNRMAAIIDNGMRQIEASEQYNKNSFNIIWFHSTGLAVNLQAEQFLSTFYGIQYIAGPNTEVKPCYGFTYAKGFEHINLDGVFISLNKQPKASVGLWVNPYAKKVNDFRKSVLYRHLEKINGLNDPALEEDVGKVYFADNITPNNPDKTLKSLRIKYKKQNLELFYVTQTSLVMHSDDL